MNSFIPVQSIITLLLTFLLFPHPSHAIPASDDLANEDARVAQLEREVRTLDPAITAVRAARVKELSLPRFKIKWMPGIILKPGTSFEDQKKIARKLAGYVVRFQGGVATDGVQGGLIGLLEGKSWYPKVAQISYRVESREPLRIDVWLDYQKPNEHGTATCCDEGEKIGTVEGDHFLSR